MRKYLIALGLLTFSTANAQFSKGDTYLSGSINGYHNDHDGQGSQSFSSAGFSPSLMFFRSDKKATGFRILGSYYNQEDGNNNIFNKRRVYGIGVGVFSQNIIPLGQSFFASVEKGINANYNWGSIQSKGMLNDVEAKVSGYNTQVYLTPGIGYKVSKRLLGSLVFNNVLQLGYKHYKETPQNITGQVPITINEVYFNSSLANNTLGGLGISFAWKLN